MGACFSCDQAHWYVWFPPPTALDEFLIICRMCCQKYPAIKKEDDWCGETQSNQSWAPWLCWGGQMLSSQFGALQFRFHGWWRMKQLPWSAIISFCDCCGLIKVTHPGLELTTPIISTWQISPSTIPYAVELPLLIQRKGVQHVWTSSFPFFFMNAQQTSVLQWMHISCRRIDQMKWRILVIG